jgi:hypothetical protein
LILSGEPDFLEEVDQEKASEDNDVSPVELATEPVQLEEDYEGFVAYEEDAKVDDDIFAEDLDQPNEEDIDQVYDDNLDQTYGEDLDQPDEPLNEIDPFDDFAQNQDGQEEVDQDGSSALPGEIPVEQEENLGDDWKGDQEDQLEQQEEDYEIDDEFGDW